MKGRVRITVFIVAAFLFGALSGCAVPLLAVDASASDVNERTHVRRHDDSLIHPVKYKAGTGVGTPALIQNLRVTSSANVARLVLDLDRQVRYTQSRRSHPDQILIRLKNVVLGRIAQTRVASGSIPLPFQIRQSSHRAVTVALKPHTFSRYKVLPLSRPPRLVVDVYPRSATPVRPAVDKVSPIVSPTPHHVVPMQPVPRPQKLFRTIVIDPGHGGRDPGARGHHGTEEKEVTLQIGLQLRELLTKQGNTRVLMTRERDVFVELEDRTKFANTNEADLFVSIHVNSHPQRNVKGLEVYHFGEAKDQRALEVAARENGTPLSSTGVGWEYLVADLLTTKKIEESLELAWRTKEAMVVHMNRRYHTVDHGVKTAPFYVLRFTSMPSILAEIAFVSNPGEEDLMRTRSFQTLVAEALSDGVRTFFNATRQGDR